MATPRTDWFQVPLASINAALLHLLGGWALHWCHALWSLAAAEACVELAAAGWCAGSCGVCAGSCDGSCMATDALLWEFLIFLRAFLLIFCVHVLDFSTNNNLLSCLDMNFYFSIVALRSTGLGKPMTKWRTSKSTFVVASATNALCELACRHVTSVVGVTKNTHTNKQTHTHTYTVKILFQPWYLVDLNVTASISPCEMLPDGFVEPDVVSFGTALRVLADCDSVRQWQQSLQLFQEARFGATDSAVMSFHRKSRCHLVPLYTLELYTTNTPCQSCPWEQKVDHGPW